jgi:ABC-type transporter Mla subunit MlaD
MEGHYANYFEIGHNVFEFVVDFGQLYPDGQQPVMHSRVIVGPTYAKRLLEVLLKSVGSYEQRFGRIADDVVATETVFERHETPPLDEADANADSTLPGTEEKVDTMTDDAPPKTPKGAIDDLSQKIDKAQSEIATKTRDLTSDQAKLALSQSTYVTVQQVLDEYTRALPNLKARRKELSDSMTGKLNFIRRVIGDAKAQQIEAAVKAVDDAITTAGQKTDQLGQQLDASKDELDQAQQTFDQRQADFNDARTFKSKLDAQLSASGTIKTQGDAVNDEKQPSRAYFLMLELQRSLNQAVVPETADYQKQLLDRWWPLINAQEPLSSLKAKVIDSEAQYGAAKASAADLRSKRTETLLAKMDELDAGIESAPIAAAGGS